MIPSGKSNHSNATAGFAQLAVNNVEGHGGLEEKSRSVTEDAKDTQSLNRNVLNKVQLEINKSYGSAQTFQLGLYKDTVGPDALSLEKLRVEPAKTVPDKVHAE